jgi:acetyl-CoA C-acetyltransferase
MKQIVIVDGVRTPIGSFGGKLASMTAPELGATAIGGVLKKSGVSPDVVTEVIMGNVLSAGMGQAPARQAAMKAGLHDRTISTTVNKVCASGMKAIMMGANQIALGESDVVVAGGMESMSNVPFYLPQQRFGNKLGHTSALDGIIKDGLWDVYKDYHMGMAAELCADECGFDRIAQDDYAVESYRRSLQARDNGWFADEIVKVKLRDRKGNATDIEQDEELDRVDFDKMRALKPVFVNTGSVTAANASSINDGAAAVVLMSAERAAELNLTPKARIVAQASAEKAPEWFTTAPSDAIPVALKRAGLTIADIDLFEINEAFAVVALANNQILGLDPAKVNVMGGAVSIGHPIGCSGARIVVTLMHALHRTGGRYGVAAICNGGGGASAIVIERI